MARAIKRPPCTEYRVVMFRPAVFLFALALTACQSAPSEDPSADTGQRTLTSDELLQNQLTSARLPATLSERGLIVELAGVSFAPNSSSLTPAARSLLQKLATIVNSSEFDTRVLTIEGHTDSVGRESYNLKLSTQRAEVVGQELVFNQVRADRITTIGYGESRPVASNTKPDGSPDPQGQAKNRRVDIVIQTAP
ncbi:OmpA family protein [Denitrobaculum tricleocarpae]|uniref:OmpA family protein n=1 Tax=Denitrobaculum tricleocarpae TaxID=2591009 RepID=A0A545TU79_9PROT|nr:OmpA family protein [Denitrobaculum tricleocarpae]